MVNDTRSGRQRSNRGTNYENELAEVFTKWPNNHQATLNLEKYLENNLEIKKNIIERMEATTNVPRLPSGGSPKTDIILTVFYKNKNQKKINISCKKTTAKSVSYHEYSANDFIKVLEITEKKLKELLIKHQNDGSANSFTNEERQYFKITIQKYKYRLWEWVILGKHGSEDVGHLVDIIITNDKVYTFVEFVSYLETKTNGFNTGLNWTYQSRGKGRTIQLKGPVL
jgi:hypothetical protein